MVRKIDRIFQAQEGIVVHADQLLKINRFGTTVLLTTHNKEIVNALKRRVITINRGKIIKDEEQGRYTLEGGK